ncbi:hypothetical protein [Micromonospora sp. CPCC 205556]|uniref:hypothetical protein n=1 Tax=Micromonospora sp. CPCC 205556 TaxID=3122398 RepID=UPI002FF2B191
MLAFSLARGVTGQGRTRRPRDVDRRDREPGHRRSRGGRVLVAFRVYRIESAPDQRAEQDRREPAADERRSQAQGVSVWYAPMLKRLPARAIEIASDMMTVNVWTAYVLNASEQPIHDVQVVFARSQPRLAVPMGGPARRIRLPELVRTVPPHQGALAVEIPSEMEHLVPSEALPNELSVALGSRDAAGRRWMRDWDGFRARRRSRAP